MKISKSFTELSFLFQFTDCPSRIKNGLVILAASYSFGSVGNLSCDYGNELFYLDGYQANHDVECMADATWSGVNKSECFAGI